MSNEKMTQKERDIFACTQVLVNAILGRTWVVGPPINITIRVKTHDELIIEVLLNIGG